jgi:hypothetical protein
VQVVVEVRHDSNDGSVNDLLSGVFEVNDDRSHCSGIEFLAHCSSRVVDVIGDESVERFEKRWVLQT